MSIDAMKAALEALERGRPQIHGALVQQDQDAAIIDLRAAIEQAKRQEPVAFDYDYSGNERPLYAAPPTGKQSLQVAPVAFYWEPSDDVVLAKHWTADKPPEGWTPLYTAPPQRQPEPEETALRLAAQWTGNQPCPKCGFAALHCRCAPPQRQPEHEGCACRWDDDDKRVATCERHQGWLDVIAEWADRARAAEDALKKQPPQRQPLTENEIEVEWQFLHDEEGNSPDHLDFARAIERAHGIGGEHD